MWSDLPTNRWPRPVYDLQPDQNRNVLLISQHSLIPIEKLMLPALQELASIRQPHPPY